MFEKGGIGIDCAQSRKAAERHTKRFETRSEVRRTCSYRASCSMGKNKKKDRKFKRTLLEEKLDEVGAILAGGTGDERDFALAIAVHGVHLAGLVLGRHTVALDGGGHRDGHSDLKLISGSEQTRRRGGDDG